jgi:C1A family cysteine protease
VLQLHARLSACVKVGDAFRLTSWCKIGLDMVGLAGTGWVPDVVDPRDFTGETPQIARLLDRLGLPSLAPQVDLRAGLTLPPVRTQGSAQSCTAFAAGSLLEYFEISSSTTKSYIESSKLFIYKTARDLLNLSSDSGAFNRTTMQALATFGAPPEQFWPYNLQNVNLEPSAFVYALASQYQVEAYYRYDPVGSDPVEVIQKVKKGLSLKFPAVCGFFLYPSLQQSQQTGEIPFPGATELQNGPVGGHSVMILGYDDAREITNLQSQNTTTGAFLIRNSWGQQWGEAGYGWLPYEYIARKLALDLWSIISARFLDISQFANTPPPATSHEKKSADPGEPEEKSGHPHPQRK